MPQTKKQQKTNGNAVQKLFNLFKKERKFQNAAFALLLVITLGVSSLAAVSFLNQQQTALANLNCPSGFSEINGICTSIIEKPNLCPSGGVLQGDQCVFTTGGVATGCFLGGTEAAADSQLCYLPVDFTVQQVDDNCEISRNDFSGSFSTINTPLCTRYTIKNSTFPHTLSYNNPSYPCTTHSGAFTSHIADLNRTNNTGNAGVTMQQSAPAGYTNQIDSKIYPEAESYRWAWNRSDIPDGNTPSYRNTVGGSEVCGGIVMLNGHDQGAEASYVGNELSDRYATSFYDRYYGLTTSSQFRDCVLNNYLTASSNAYNPGACLTTSGEAAGYFRESGINRAVNLCPAMGGYQWDWWQGQGLSVARCLIKTSEQPGLYQDFTMYGAFMYSKAAMIPGNSYAVNTSATCPTGYQDQGYQCVAFANAVSATIDQSAIIGGACDPATLAPGEVTTCTYSLQPLTGSTQYVLPPEGLFTNIYNGTISTANELSLLSAPCYITGNDTLVCNQVEIRTDAPQTTGNVFIQQPGIQFLDPSTTVNIIPTTQITNTNVSTSSNCVNTAAAPFSPLSVELGTEIDCVFRLTGSPNNTYELPDAGMTANVDTATGSSACTIDNFYQPVLSWNLNSADQTFVDGTLFEPFATGQSTFTYDTNYNEIKTGWSIEATADLNSDSFVDYIWYNYTTGDVAYWLTDGVNLVEGGFIYNGVGGNWHLFGANDVNGDGTPDLGWYNESVGYVGIWFLNSDLTIDSTVTIDDPNNPGNPFVVPPATFNARGLADMNNDGVADIIWRDVTNGDISYWYLTSAAGIGSTATFGDNTAGLAWKIQAIADMDGDGNNDFVWQNTDITGEVVIWRMSNTNIGAANVVLSTTNLTNGEPNWRIVGAGNINGDSQNDIVWKYYNAVDPSLICKDIPTVNGTAGLQAINLNDGASVSQKGDVNLIDSTGTIITINNVGESSNCNGLDVVVIGESITCRFPLQGVTNNIYELPSQGITAVIETATGQSQACTINNNGTENAELLCEVIPSTDGTVGTQNVNVQIGTDASVDKGDVNLVSPITQNEIDNGFIDPNNPNGPTIPFNTATNLSCTDTVLGGTSDCTGTLPDGYIAPGGTLELNVEGQPGVVCVFEEPTNPGSAFTCQNLPAGNTGGTRNIQATVDGGTPGNTGETINVATVATGIQLIEQANIEFSPSKDQANEFCGTDANNPRCDDLVIAVVNDSRIQDGAICQFEARFYPFSGQPNPAYSSSVLTPTNGQATYTNGRCEVTLPRASQTQARWEFKVRVTNPSSGTNADQVYGADPAYFMLYGAVGIVNISGSSN